jgi:uncharacterized damage-inducible protein DinB
VKAQILKYLEYNVWANQVLIDYLNTKPTEQLEQEIVSSFPSIRKTLLHIWDAEVMWQMRLKGTPVAEFPSKSFVGDMQAIFDNLIKSSSDFVILAEAEKEDFLTKVHTYMTMSYGETSQNSYDMMHHCINHSTYHRGQIMTMLRQLGYTDLPHLDFMLFLILRNATK